MAGALRNTMVYLGLAERQEPYDSYEDEYDEDEEFVDELPEELEEPELAPVVTRNLEPVNERRAAVTPISRGRMMTAAKPELHRITTVHPRSYNEAKTIGEAFRAGTPVIMNLSELDDADAKRLVDFAAGLVFGLHGSIERVTNKVFLLSPSHVEVSTAEKVKQPERTFFNQS